MSDLRPVDYNGHVPGSDASPRTLADRRELHSAEYQLGYQQAVIDLLCAGLTQCQEILTEALAGLERRSAA